MLKTYICSPYSGNVEQNVKDAIRYCRFAIGDGHMPIASHLLYPQILDDDNPHERELGMRYAIELLSLCRELWVFADKEEDITAGMHREIQEAYVRGLWVRYFTRGLEPHGRQFNTVEHSRDVTKKVKEWIWQN